MWGKENIGQIYITTLCPHSRGEGFLGEGGTGVESQISEKKNGTEGSNSRDPFPAAWGI